MKLLLNENLYYWNLTGLLGKDASWFFGFSKKVIPENVKEAEEYIDNLIATKVNKVNKVNNE